MSAGRYEEGQATAVKIGIPRAFHFYEFYPLWVTFFRHLGAEVVVSRPTDDAIVRRGVALAEDDACVPLKIFLGHLDALKDQVDCVFVPRMVSVERATYTCPKFLGLPEVARFSQEGLPPVISIDVNLSRGRRRFYRNVLKLGKRFTGSPWRIWAAYYRGVKVQQQYTALLGQGRPPKDALAALGLETAANRRARPRTTGEGEKLVVAVLGHPYLIQDSHLNLDLNARLEELGVRVVTAEGVPEDAIGKALETLDKAVYWSAGRRTLGAGLHFLDPGRVDGIVQLNAFGCGPDSLTGEILERRARRSGRVPLLVLNLDEHAAEAGIVTRLEAFVDLIRRRRSIA